MEVDPTKYRALVTYLLQSFREIEKELLAHQIVFLWIAKAEGNREELEKLLQEARSSSVLQQHLHEKYDVALLRLADLSEADFVKESLELLRRIPSQTREDLSDCWAEVAAAQLKRA